MHLCVLFMLTEMNRYAKKVKKVTIVTFPKTYISVNRFLEQ